MNVTKNGKKIIEGRGPLEGMAGKDGGKQKEKGYGREELEMVRKKRETKKEKS